MYTPPHSPNIVKISKEDIAVATELAGAADVAGELIHKRRRRQYLMERCADNVEKLCRDREQNYEGGSAWVEPFVVPAAAAAACPVRIKTRSVLFCETQHTPIRSDIKGYDNTNMAVYNTVDW